MTGVQTCALPISEYKAYDRILPTDRSRTCTSVQFISYIFYYCYFFLIPSFLISAFISFCTVWPILSHDFHFLACYNFIFFHFFSPLIWKLNSFFLLIFKIFQRLLFVLKLHMITTLIIIFFHFNWFIIFNSLTIIKFIWWKLYCFLFIS